MTHWLGATQSTALWQGEAHLPAWTLQWYQPQIASLWHGSARRPGVAIAPDATGAGAGAGPGDGAGAGAGAGGAGGAYVGAGCAV